jgi:hypothetical protein
MKYCALAMCLITSAFGQMKPIQKSDAAKRYVEFPCKPSMQAHLDIEGEGTQLGVNDLLFPPDDGECLLRTKYRLTDLTLNGVHYEWCGPTANGVTRCKIAPKKAAK